MEIEGVRTKERGMVENDFPDARASPQKQQTPKAANVVFLATTPSKFSIVLAPTLSKTIHGFTTHAVNKAAKVIVLASSLSTFPSDARRGREGYPYRGTSIIKNSPHPRTNVGPYVWSYCRVLGGGCTLAVGSPCTEQSTGCRV